MSKSGVQANFYLGVVKEYSGEFDFKITADIPGVISGVNAFPIRGDCDEPKPGDPIILLGLDPLYNSYFLYWKLKENDFTGFRVKGRQISFQESGIRISIDEPESSEGEGEEEEGGNSKESDAKVLDGEVSRIDLDTEGNIEVINKSGAFMKLDSDGNLEFNNGNEAKITLDSEGNIEANNGQTGKLSITSDGVVRAETAETSSIELDGQGNINIEIRSGTVKLKGFGTLELPKTMLANGIIPTGFLSEPLSLPAGSPHKYTNKIVFIGD